MNTNNNNVNFKAPGSMDELLASIEGVLSRVRGGETWATYSRVSQVDPQKTAYSMETQPENTAEYARAHGAVEVVSYADPDQTGKNSRRKGLQAMVRDIEAGKIDVVVVHRLDRLYRNLSSLLEFIQKLKLYGVRLVSVTEQIDTETWWGRLVLAVLGSLAEAYLHQISTTTRDALDARRRKGFHLGPISLGYCNGLCSTCADVNGAGYCPLHGGLDRPESQRGHLAVPHPVDQHVIPLIFQLYQQNFSFREIAIYLNNTSFKLPDGTDVRFRPRGKAGEKSNE